MWKCVYHGDKSSNKLEIFEVVWVDGRGGVDLQTVVVFTGIFKKTIHGVQNFMRQQEKPFPVRDTYTHNHSYYSWHILFIFVLLITGLISCAWLKLAVEMQTIVLWYNSGEKKKKGSCFGSIWTKFALEWTGNIFRSIFNHCLWNLAFQ